ncbi:MAG: dockerin type I repeat-containing protein, partial [Phycisphaerales bacterium]|nr:dockerin type I repeat-containing protein [Phycisphaerales bacterium]
PTQTACLENSPIRLFEQTGQTICLGSPANTKPFWFNVPFGFSPEQQFPATDLDGDGIQDRLIFDATLRTEPWEFNNDQPSTMRYVYLPSTSSWSFRNEGPTGTPTLSFQSIIKGDNGWVLANTPVVFSFDDIAPDDMTGNWTLYPCLYDVDGDSQPDLILIWSRNSGTPDFINATWHRNIASKDPCLGDVNLDGKVDGLDLSRILGNWDSTNQLYDIDGNGLVDGADLNIILGAWGVCP